jgi:hypothetical protein
MAWERSQTVILGEIMREPTTNPPKRQRKIDTGWLPDAGSERYRWETELRQKLARVRWVGELALSEAKFAELCAVIRKEAWGMPKHVPAAMFMVSLVFSARYAVLEEDETTDEFWSPYYRTVWHKPKPYEQTFYLQCKARFQQVAPYLETYGLTFKGLGFSAGDVVTPVFRHALLPKYVQDDFAEWLCNQWENILQFGDDPTLLMRELKAERSLKGLRLKQFIHGEKTASTAVAIITNIANALNLHLKEDEPAEKITDLLKGVERELWYKVSQHIARQKSEAKGRTRQARLEWVWDIERQEMALRLRELTITLTGNQTEPQWVRWLATTDEELYEKPVVAWRLPDGAYWLETLILPCPDAPWEGEIRVEDDEKNSLWQKRVPLLPTGELLFFRQTQQRALGIVVGEEQLSDGEWLVCASTAVDFFSANDNDKNSPQPITESLTIPYPLDRTGYTWAAIINLRFPLQLRQENGKLRSLTARVDIPAVGRPRLSGDQIAGLSPYLPPVFSTTNITLHLNYGAKPLLQHATLRLIGQGNKQTRIHETHRLKELQEMGMVAQIGDGLEIRLADILHRERADVYQLQLYRGVTPIWQAAQEIAVVPGLQIHHAPDGEQMYTPANLPSVSIRGITPDRVEPAAQQPHTITPEEGDAWRLDWHTVRQEPQLTLKFDERRIQLAWSVPRCDVWLEAVPSEHELLTLENPKEELLLCGVAKHVKEDPAIWLDGEKYTQKFNRKGEMRTSLVSKHLSEGLRRYQEQGGNVPLEVRVAGQCWPLKLSLKPMRPRKPIRPSIKINRVKVWYDALTAEVVIETDLPQTYPGHGRVTVSISQQQSKTITLELTQLAPTMRFPIKLERGRYIVGLEFEGEHLLMWLPPKDKQFTVEQAKDTNPPISQASPPPDTNPIALKQLGELIPANTPAEDFLRQAITLIANGQATMSPRDLWRLATLPRRVLEKYSVDDIKKLDLVWLTAVREVYQPTIQQEEKGWRLWKILYDSSVERDGTNKDIHLALQKKPPPQGRNSALIPAQQTATWEELSRKIQAWRNNRQLLQWQKYTGRLCWLWANTLSQPKNTEYAFVLGVLLRTAVYNRPIYVYDHLRKQANLTDEDVYRMLTAYKEQAPAHLAWGLAWAERIYLYSARP